MSDSPRAADLIPVDGSWEGLLFENPFVGYPRSLTWRFRIQFDELVTDTGRISPSISVDGIMVQPDDVSNDFYEARRQLSELTDIAGLKTRARGNVVQFEVA